VVTAAQPTGCSTPTVDFAIGNQIRDVGQVAGTPKRLKLFATTL